MLGGNSGNEYPGLNVEEILEQLDAKDLPKHNVIVYGSLRKGMDNHTLLSEGIKSKEVIDLGKAAVYLPARMYDTGYGFPSIVPDVTKSIFVVEQYKVNDAYINRLDALEGYPEIYNSTQTLVNGELSWVYYQPQAEAGYEEIQGDWVRYRRA